VKTKARRAAAQPGGATPKADAARAPADAPGADAPARASSEAKNAAIRAQLQPLQPGERPMPIVVASIVAALLSTSNIALYLAGTEINGRKPSAVGPLLLSGLILVSAIGMWRLRYWAVLGFQTILALTVVFSSLTLLVSASSVLGVVGLLAIVGSGGWLFLRLVRVMARMQMPERRR
jgi:hypothetical protein